ncbi:CRISPR-associated endonuclease Cas2 [Ligilactobacillus aviarius]|uniref:CRISPR-associated endonuclease Cas2 n=1 Tax=Ligilactobacillus aviarius TaxID=1606 RepID=UPI0024B8C1C4|nr:CRISPR-associated endonuclease Cas2 [Ligilactobacillus aviarius]
MSYEKMRVFCMFDLPVDTPEKRRAYRVFRKGLIENGFTMIQYSVYQRIVPNRRSGKKYEEIIKKFIPSNGDVRIIYISEKQYNDMKILVGSKSKQEEIVGSNKMVVI